MGHVGLVTINGTSILVPYISDKLLQIIWNIQIPVASFTKEVNPWLAKRPMVFIGSLANHGLTSIVKETTDLHLSCRDELPWYDKDEGTRIVALAMAVRWHSLLQLDIMFNPLRPSEANMRQ